MLSRRLKKAMLFFISMCKVLYRKEINPCKNKKKKIWFACNQQPVYSKLLTRVSTLVYYNSPSTNCTAHIELISHSPLVYSFLFAFMYPFNSWQICCTNIGSTACNSDKYNVMVISAIIRYCNFAKVHFHVITSIALSNIPLLSYLQLLFRCCLRPNFRKGFPTFNP